MRKIRFSIAMAALIWSACSKPEIPKGSFEDPVFSMSIESDSTISADFVAGQDRRYLFTNVNLGPDSVLTMSGAFADVSCPSGDCPGSVQFKFRNVEFGNVVEPNLIFSKDFFWNIKSFQLDPPYLRTVSIRWVTPDGTILLSDLAPQPQQDSSIYFHILNSEAWELNENGEKTWKMNVDFSCMLLDSQQVKLLKVLGSGVIAVGYQ